MQPKFMRLQIFTHKRENMQWLWQNKFAKIQGSCMPQQENTQKRHKIFYTIINIFHTINGLLAENVGLFCKVQNILSYHGYFLLQNRDFHKEYIENFASLPLLLAIKYLRLNKPPRSRYGSQVQR